MSVSENVVDIFRLISESHSLSPRIPFGSSLGWRGQSLLKVSYLKAQTQNANGPKGLNY